MGSPRILNLMGQYSGILAVAIFCVLYPIAAILDPDYIFMENYLSDLGVGPGAWAFNSALAVSGVLLSIFAIFGLFPAIGSGIWSKLASSSFAIAGAFLLCIGIFTEDFDEVHTFFSFAFFITLLITLGLMSAAMYSSGSLGRFATGTSIAAFISGACLVPLGANPLTETIAVLIILAWGSVISFLMLMRHHGQGHDGTNLRC